jgi:hypothetical protein
MKLVRVDFIILHLRTLAKCFVVVLDFWLVDCSVLQYWGLNPGFSTLYHLSHTFSPHLQFYCASGFGSEYIEGKWEISNPFHAVEGVKNIVSGVCVCNTQMAIEICHIL